MLKVLDDNSLVRDPYSKALLTVDTSALNEHRRKRLTIIQNQENANRINTLEANVTELKTELTDIKSLLIKLVEKH